MTTTNSTRRALALGAAMVMFAAPAAHASVIDRHTEPVGGEFQVACDGFTIDATWQGEQTVTVKQRGAKTFVFETAHGGFTSTWDALGVRWTSANRFQYKDQRIISVQGNLTTLLVGVTQHFNVYDPSGRPDSGFDRRVEWRITIDTTTGEVVDSTDWTKNVGHYSISDECHDAVRFSTQ